MRILVIGATGHIGSYLVPRLVREGHEVIAMARHNQPRHVNTAMEFSAINWELADVRAEETTSALAQRLAKIDVDVVVDLISFTVEQATIIADAFAGRIGHLLHCGSIWAYGPGRRVPHRECDPRHPASNYGINKTAIETALLARWQKEQLPVTVIHPGHISGRRWLPIDPQGAINGTEIYRRLAVGETVALPGRGLAALQHVHGDDVAQVFDRAIQKRATALGQVFSAVAPYGMTLLGCCEAVAALFGKTPVIDFVSDEAFKCALGDKAFNIALRHLQESVICSPEKAEQLLGYKPRYTTEEIYAECVDYMLETGDLKVT